MAKEKNKPVPVRFDLKLLEVLKEEEKIDSPQQALNFLAKFWENNRPAKDDLTGDLESMLRHFEPFGVGNPAPALLARGVRLAADFTFWDGTSLPMVATIAAAAVAAFAASSHWLRLKMK